MQIKVNGEAVSIPEAWREASLLEWLREGQGLVGTKFGCGKGLCGACTVHLDGQPLRACQLPLAAVGDAEVTTIEGLAEGDALHPVQQAWVEGSVPQCGYCQAGQIMTAAAFLAKRDRASGPPSAGEVRRAMDGNLCRCGTYTRIRAAVLRADAIERAR